MATATATDELSTLSTDGLMELAAASSRRMACEAGSLVRCAAELERRQGWRAEGATSLEAWIVERCGVSLATARSFAHVAGTSSAAKPVTDLSCNYSRE